MYLINVKNNYVSHFIIPISFLFLYLSCEEKITEPEEIEQTNFSVKLQNQSDHSGVMLKFLGLDSIVVSDSAGNFDLSNLPDGTFNIEIKYPYFETIHAEVEVINEKICSGISLNLELKQLLQFWIEPAETTISMNNAGNPYYFSLNVFRQYRVNISDNPVDVYTTVAPRDLWALVPLDNEWPYVPNPDSLPYCYRSYNWFGGTDLQDLFGIVLQPYDTSFVTVGPTFASPECFAEASYLFYSAISDLSHYPEYFDPAYVYGFRGEGKNHLYQEMNRSILKKTELFRPAVVHITN